MAKIDELLTDYARAITNDRIDGITLTQAQSDRIKAARLALISYVVKSQSECPVCSKPIYPSVWCSLECMDKAIGPTVATPKT